MTANHRRTFAEEKIIQVWEENEAWRLERWKDHAPHEGFSEEVSKLEGREWRDRTLRVHLISKGLLKPQRPRLSDPVSEAVISARPGACWTDKLSLSCIPRESYISRRVATVIPIRRGDYPASFDINSSFPVVGKS